MKAAVFLDTSYLLALVNSADQHHLRAQTTALQVQPPFLTTEAILVEVGNAFSRLRWRHLAINTLAFLQQDSNINIVSIDTVLLNQAIALYRSRLDKEWGLTDCISFVVMQNYGLTQILTLDHHFEQAGFQNIML